VKDCGPIAQKVAANKLEGLKFQQPSNANTSNVVDKNIFVNNNYQAFAAALMHTSIYDNAEKFDNVCNMIRQKNFSASNQNMPISGSFSCSMPIIVHPTSVISTRPRENPFQS
jgi:hypothetical protein